MSKKVFKWLGIASVSVISIRWCIHECIKVRFENFVTITKKSMSLPLGFFPGFFPFGRFTGTSEYPGFPGFGQFFSWPNNSSNGSNGNSSDYVCPWGHKFEDFNGQNSQITNRSDNQSNNQSGSPNYGIFGFPNFSDENNNVYMIHTPLYKRMIGIDSNQRKYDSIKTGKKYKIKGYSYPPYFSFGGPYVTKIEEVKK